MVSGLNKYIVSKLIITFDFMKGIYSILIAIALLSISGVYGEGAKTPALTLITEKAVPALSHGAIIKPSAAKFESLEAIPQEPMRLDRINWHTDEHFFTCGYKDLLSEEVKQIIAPPECWQVYKTFPLRL